jgi:hypothetical protein
MEAKDLIVPAVETSFPFISGPLFQSHSEHVSEPPDFSLMDEPVRTKVSFDQNTNTLSIAGKISESEMKVIQGCFANPQDRASVEQIYHRALGQTGVPTAAAQTRRLPCPY